MSTTTTKPTAASQLEAVKAELARKAAEAEQVKAALAQQAAENAQIRAINEGLAKEAAANRERVTALEAEVARFQEALTAEKTKQEAAAKLAENAVSSDANLVEVVALPPNPNVKVSPLTYKGEKVRMEKDKDGFFHFWAPRRFAERLLGGTAGMKYVLAGPDGKITIRRFGSSRSEVVTVYKHVKAQYPTGGAFWQPVIEEESGDGNA
jgi:hypothetical protein